MNHPHPEGITYLTIEMRTNLLALSGAEDFFVASGNRLPI